VSCNAGGII
jgi:hypothetical protein